jgi:hypothetical protein
MGSLFMLMARIPQQIMEIDDIISKLNSLDMKGEAQHDYSQKDHTRKQTCHF